MYTSFGSFPGRDAPALSRHLDLSFPRRPFQPVNNLNPSDPSYSVDQRYLDRAYETSVAWMRVWKAMLAALCHSFGIRSRIDFADDMYIPPVHPKMVMTGLQCSSQSSPSSPQHGPHLDRILQSNPRACPGPAVPRSCME
jgi:hypothetical protein